MGKLLRSFGLLLALTTGYAACRSEKAGIILDVSTADSVDPSVITALDVTVNGRTQTYAVGDVVTWSVGIETSAGSKNITVSGMAQATLIAQWSGVVEAVTGKVVHQVVVLQPVANPPIDGGSDGAGIDGPPGSGGAAGRDGAVGSGGIGGGPGTGGRSGLGGMPASGGVPGNGGVSGSGGLPGTGGIVPAGGAPGTGGIVAVGGVPGTGGTIGLGGRPGTGGIVASGGTISASGGGPGTGGRSVSGGNTSSGGVTGTGGVVGSGGTAATGGTIVCAGTLPTGGMQHSANGDGTAGSLHWYLWSNISNSGSMTTFATPAFGASWNNAGDFLARLGLKLNQSKTYDQYGTIAADFSETKTGSGGGFSFIGIYGWTVNPCIEFYIIEDTFSSKPVGPGGTSKGTATIDGGTYTLYSRATTGTGGSLCAGVTSWTQFTSVRSSSRQCGHISISEHFDAWAAAGMALGKLDSVTILVETGGGTGSSGCTTANVTTAIP